MQGTYNPQAHQRVADRGNIPGPRASAPRLRGFGCGQSQTKIGPTGSQRRFLKQSHHCEYRYLDLRISKADCRKATGRDHAVRIDANGLSQCNVIAGCRAADETGHAVLSRMSPNVTEAVFIGQPCSRRAAYGQISSAKTSGSEGRRSCDQHDVNIPLASKGHDHELLDGALPGEPGQAGDHRGSLRPEWLPRFPEDIAVSLTNKFRRPWIATMPVRGPSSREDGTGSKRLSVQ